MAVNLRQVDAGEFTIEGCGLEDEIWREQTFDYDAEVKGGALKDKLGPSQVKVFVRG